MAKDRVIEITGLISQFEFSMNYVKYMMDQLGEGPITVKCTSLGGDVNHALKMKEMFASHGDVTVEYIGFNASAATLLGHGAVKSVIHEDSFYLVHKPMVWVDAWGSMNEDEIAQAIIDMTAQKKDAETVTLVLAQDYVNSCGIEMSKIMQLMQDSQWLSAKDAVSLGLVGEIVPTTSKNKKTIITNEMVAMMTANGFPVPEMEQEDPKLLALIGKEISKQFDKFSNKFTPKPLLTMNKDLTFVNQVLAVEGIVVAENKADVTLEQLTTINNELKTKSDAIATANAEKETAVTEKTTAETALNDATSKIDAIDPSVKAATTVEAKVAAITAILASRPAVAAARPQGENAGEIATDKAADFEVIDSLAHNKAADREV